VVKKTKIIATVGPTSESADVIEKMIENGVDIFRFNLKHNNFDWHKKIIERVREVAKRLKKSIGIMIDFQGPEIRLETKNGLPVEIKKDEVFWISDKLTDNSKVIKVDPEIVLKYIKKDEKIFIDNGNYDLRVLGKIGNKVKVVSDDGLVIKNRKSLNIISDDLDLPMLASRDKGALARLAEINPDYIALSFVRNEKDIEVLKKLLLKIDPEVKVVAKIENARAIKNIEAIIKVSDGIMVARGDLGIEIPLEELAFWQKKIIDLCRLNSKPVIVATQMLLSMVENNKPTRAEVSDVSNAVFDGTDALMLSEETSIGVNPPRVIKEMKEIVEFCEKSNMCRHLKIKPLTSTEVLVDAAVKIIGKNKDLKIAAVIIFTQSGTTARIFSRYRVNLPIIAITDNKDTVKGLLISYGVKSFIKKLEKTCFKMPQALIDKLIYRGFVSKGDDVLIMHGGNWMESGATSDISLVTV
jgi:pyruvate kinase